MDDYSLVSLSDSKNEWCARLVNTLSPCIIEGLKSIFDEAWNLCLENEEEDKYLMTFQTFLSRIPKWNTTIIQTEKKRIEETSECKYLEELITCVHVIQLKALTCARVGHKQKKVDIDIPSVDTFIHRVYCNVARKLYTSVYLFEKDILPLEIQKHNRELEVIIKECILNTVRDTMPIEKILQTYLDETEELDVNEEIVVINDNVKATDVTTEGENKPADGNNDEIKSLEPPKVVVEQTPKVVEQTPKVVEQTPKVVEQTPKVVEQTPKVVEQTPKVVVEQTPKVDVTPVVTEPVTTAPTVSVNPITTPAITVQNDTTPKDKVNFTDIDNRMDVNGNIDSVVAPKTDERLEEISALSAERRRREEEEEDEDDDEKIKIGDDISLNITDVNDLNNSMDIKSAPILDDIEVLT